MHELAFMQVNPVTDRTQDELMALVRLGIGGRAGTVPEPVARVPQPAVAGRVW
jgi:hypothetical protein